MNTFIDIIMSINYTLLMASFKKVKTSYIYNLDTDNGNNFMG